MSSVHAALPGALEERLRDARERAAPLGELYPFTPRFLAHDGVHQHYVDEGPPDAEPLLFLHGNPTWSFLWREPIRALAGLYRCVAPDHVGCGLSDKPGAYEYRLARHADNAARLVRELDLWRLTLVMHDWGGAIGMGLARRLPERVARLVVMNGAAFRAGGLPWRLPRRIAVCRVPLLGQVAVRGFNAFARGAARMAVELRLPRAVERGYLLPYDSYENRVATLAFVEDIPLGPEHPSWAELKATEDALESFRDRPTSILWGERDWCFTPAFRAEWERRFPRASVRRYERAGHYVVEDARDAVVRDLTRFLAESPLR